MADDDVTLDRDERNRKDASCPQTLYDEGLRAAPVCRAPKGHGRQLADGDQVVGTLCSDLQQPRPFRSCTGYASMPLAPLVTALKRSHGQLEDTQRRLDAVLNNASVAIFLMNDRQRCIYMNRAAEKLTGFTLDEVLALDRPLHDIVHHTRPDGSHFPLEECAIDRAFPEHNQMQGEEVFVHKDGNCYPVAFTASPIRDEASKTIGTIIEVRDIREERAAKERQRLLIDELNHRVKNTISAVQSIAYQSLKGADAGARQAFEGRLAALSAAHNVLTKEGWTGASLCIAIKTAIAPFEAPGRFVLEGEDHPLAPKMVVSLSMVIHELATNSVKYGSLSAPGGAVRIEWRLKPDANGQRLLMRWEESGGPPVEPPTRTGFGTRLLERQFAMEFGGSVKLDYRPTGLVCEIDLRLPSPSHQDQAATGDAGAR